MMWMWQRGGGQQSGAGQAALFQRCCSLCWREVHSTPPPDKEAEGPGAAKLVRQRLKRRGRRRGALLESTAQGDTRRRRKARRGGAATLSARNLSRGFSTHRVARMSCPGNAKINAAVFASFPLHRMQWPRSSAVRTGSTAPIKCSCQTRAPACISALFDSDASAEGSAVRAAAVRPVAALARL